MIRRAMTLLEVLMALTLLAALATAATAWTVTSLRVSAGVPADLAWRSAAEATLALIADDLACGDFPPGSPEQRIRIDDRQLSVMGRGTPGTSQGAGGASEHRYRLAEEGRIVLAVSSLGTDRRGVPSERTLIADVAELTFEIDDETAVRIRIRRSDGLLIERTVLLP